MLGTGGGAQRLHWMLEGAFDEELQALTPNFLAVSRGAQHAARPGCITKWCACTYLPEPIESCLRWLQVLAVELWHWQAAQGCCSDPCMQPALYKLAVSYMWLCQMGLGACRHGDQRCLCRRAAFKTLSHATSISAGLNRTLAEPMIHHEYPCRWVKHWLPGQPVFWAKSAGPTHAWCTTQMVLCTCPAGVASHPGVGAAPAVRHPA